MVNEVDHSQTNNRYRSPYDALFLNDGIRVYDITRGDSLIYEETRDRYTGMHLDTIKYVNLTNDWTVYKFLTLKQEITTDVFDGLQVSFRMPQVFAQYDSSLSGWVTGNAPLGLYLKKLANPKEMPYLDTYRFFPWNYEIVWTDNNAAYKSRVQVGPKFTDHTGNFLSAKEILLGQLFNFYVINKSFKDSTGQHPRMDMVVVDKNGNRAFDPDGDLILVGDTVKDSRTGSYVWSETIFVIDLKEAHRAGRMPKANDVYRIDFLRPFYYNDAFVFTVHAGDKNLAAVKEDMEKIRVVPNPYVATNTMEPAVANWERNQRRQIMFTHLPAQCTVTIFTLSGVLVDRIEVNNSTAGRVHSWDTNSDANGTAHWDLRSREGLEVAAGYYIYHVHSALTGDKKVGKFAIIK
jgi:hypothetical protein